MNKPSANNAVYDTTIRLFILLLIIAWCLLIIYPFVHIVLWSLIISLALFPLHKSLSIKFGGKPKLVSIILVLGILAIFIVPAGLVISSMVDEVKELKALSDKDGFGLPPPSESVKEWPIIGEGLYNSWKNASVSLGQTLVKYKEQLTEIGGRIAKGLLAAAGDMIQILVSVIIAGVLLITRGTGEGLRKLFRKIAGDRGDEFADLTLSTVGNVIKGIIGVAFIVSALHSILFFLAGIPYAGIWTILIFVLAIIQIPSFIVTVPIIIYVFSVKEPVPAVIWSVLLAIAGMADNVLKPLLLGKGASVPMLVIFIGVIGGFMLSGFLGLFTGAIVMSLGYKLYVSWVDGPETLSTDS